MKIGNLRQAAKFYAKAKMFANSFECFERMEDWEGLLLCLQKNLQYFDEAERLSLIEKYFPIALNQLYVLYSNFDPSMAGISEENKGKVQ